MTGQGSQDSEVLLTWIKSGSGVILIGSLYNLCLCVLMETKVVIGTAAKVSSFSQDRGLFGIFGLDHVHALIIF